MTTYAVIWTETAFTMLSRFVAASDDVPAMRKASDQIDFVLRRLPTDVGESRSGPYRIWFGPVFCVYYRVAEESMQVKIMFLGLSRR